MNPFLTFLAAMASRALGTLAMSYSQWLFEKLLDGADFGLGLVADAWHFLEYLYQMVAHQVSDRHSYYQ